MGQSAPFQPLADATRIRPGRWTAVLATMVALRQFCPSGIGVGRPLVTSRITVGASCFVLQPAEQKG